MSSSLQPYAGLVVVSGQADPPLLPSPRLPNPPISPPPHSVFFLVRLVAMAFSVLLPTVELLRLTGEVLSSYHPPPGCPPRPKEMHRVRFSESPLTYALL